MQSHPLLKARNSRSGSWNKWSQQRWPHIYPLDMRHNQARCRNQRTSMPFPPRSRCMLQCLLSFCICQLRIARMFLTLLLMLHHNSRPPPPSPEYTQRTRSQAPRRKAACDSSRARLYARDAKWFIAFIAPKNKHANTQANAQRAAGPAAAISCTCCSARNSPWTCGVLVAAESVAKIPLLSRGDST